jgi:hypothetical protein
MAPIAQTASATTARPGASGGLVLTLVDILTTP